MQVIINADHNLDLNEKSIRELESDVEAKLAHFSSRLTRVEVHVTGESAGRATGDDIRCQIEARPEGRAAETASDQASSVDGAVAGALRKMQHVLETTFGRLDHRKGNTSMGGAESR